MYTFTFVLLLFYLYTDDDRFEVPDRLTREALGVERKDSVPLPYMPGRLRACMSVWRRTTRDSFVLSTIDNGYRIEWNEKGPPPSKYHENSPNCSNHEEFIDTSIREALIMGVVSEASADTLNNISPLNVDVKKSNGKRRLIFNAMFINDYMLVQKFKYPQLHKEGREIFGQSRWGFVLDISQAFYHIEIHPEFYRYLGFSWKGKYYYWRCCPFGVSFGPWLWDRVLSPVLDSLKKHGVNIMAFCDDILGGKGKKPQADEDGLRLRATLKHHGYICQEIKCHGIGDALPVIPGLGMIIQLDQQKYFMTPKRQAQIISMAQGLLNSRYQRARLLSQFAGVIMSQIAAIGPIARIRTRYIYACIQTRLFANEKSSSESYDRVVFVDEKTYKELHFWAHMTHKYNGQDIVWSMTTVSYHCQTSSDASATGYGGFLQIPLYQTRESVNRILSNAQDIKCSISVSQAQQGLDVWGSFTAEQRTKSSSWRELFGSGKLFQTFGPLLSGTTVPLYLDSQVAVMALGGDIPLYPCKIFGGSKTLELQDLVSWIYDIAEQYNFGIRAVWIPRSLNERSDFNSHLNEYNHYDFCLTREAFGHLEHMFGPHSIDRFSSDNSAQLPRYNTKYFSPKAEALDAFSLNWDGDNNYVFPPPSLVGQAIYHARSCGAMLTLVYMEWHSRPYMHSLRECAFEGSLVTSVRLGCSTSVLEYRDAYDESRYQHLPKGMVFAARLDFINKI